MGAFSLIVVINLLNRWFDHDIIKQSALFEVRVWNSSSPVRIVGLWWFCREAETHSTTRSWVAIRHLPPVTNTTSPIYTSTTTCNPTNIYLFWPSTTPTTRIYWLIIILWSIVSIYWGLCLWCRQLSRTPPRPPTTSPPRDSLHSRGAAAGCPPPPPRWYQPVNGRSPWPHKTSPRPRWMILCWIT